ncbi:hypothetical protein MTO96_009770 [Rhipicephalus appendiculatus]
MPAQFAADDIFRYGLRHLGAQPQQRLLAAGVRPSRNTFALRPLCSLQPLDLDRVGGLGTLPCSVKDRKLTADFRELFPPFVYDDLS